MISFGGDEWDKADAYMTLSFSAMNLTACYVLYLFVSLCVTNRASDRVNEGSGGRLSLFFLGGLVKVFFPILVVGPLVGIQEEMLANWYLSLVLTEFILVIFLVFGTCKRKQIRRMDRDDQERGSHSHGVSDFDGVCVIAGPELTEEESLPTYEEITSEKNSEKDMRNYHEKPDDEAVCRLPSFEQALHL